MSDSLIALLRTRGDLSRKQLVMAGYNDVHLRALVTSGDVERIGRATYGVPRPELTREQRHARLATAILRRYDGAVVLSHHSALATANLPLHGVPLDLAHVTAVRGARYRRRTDHVLHAADGSSRDAVKHAPATRVELGDALVQTGLRWGATAMLPPADAALRVWMVSMADLARAVDRYAHAPGMAEVRMAVAATDPLAESVGESLLRWSVQRLGYATASHVDPGCLGRAYRLDLVIARTRIALEFDGVAKYGSLPSDQAATLRAEKARDENLQAAGWYVIHVTWPELFRPAVVSRRIEAGLTWLARAA